MEINNVLRLREVLKEKNVTGKELAQLLNLTETSISRILNGLQYPKLETLLSISTVLNVDIKDLFNSTTATDILPLYVKVSDTEFKEVGQLDISKLDNTPTANE